MKTVFKLSFMILLIFQDCRKCEGKYPFHETQDASAGVANQMLLVMDRTLENLAKRELLNIVVEIEIILARANLQYTLEKITTEADHEVLRGSLGNLTKKLKEKQDRLHVHHITPDVAKSMKILSDNYDRLKSALAPITIGQISNQRTLTMPAETYKKFIIRHENLYNKTDRCLQKLLDMGNEMVQNRQKCVVDSRCYDYFLRRGNYGVFNVQAGLHVAVAKFFNCAPKRAANDLIKLCENMYEEVLSIERYGYSDHLSEVFGFQLSFCGTMGFGEFLKPRWIKLLLSWEDSAGAFRNPRSSTADASILEAEVLGVLAVYVRAILASE